MYVEDELQSFDWMTKHPDHLKHLQKVMTGFKRAEWSVGFGTLDIEAQKVPFTSTQPFEKLFFVDVEGGHFPNTSNQARIIPASSATCAPGSARSSK
ncbi:o-methyltransferase domain-containing protein [Penicillium sp. IBT 18751x]|nr:o-methyltransferase domain-containing protein [Penicillium sp. IBT 18751x]